MKTKIKFAFMFVVMIFAMMTGSVTPVKAAEVKVYVRANGSDTSGDGTLTNPYATIKKAYDSLTVDGSILLLSNINMLASTTTTTSVTPSSYVAEYGKNKVIMNKDIAVTIESGNVSGNGLTNEAGNYEGVYTVFRDATYKCNFIDLKNGSLRLKNIIFDGNTTPFEWGNVKSTGTPRTQEGFFIYVKGSNTEVVMDTNSILQNNNNTGDSGVAVGGAVVLNTGNRFTMQSNAVVRGNIAPRHGGAFTLYDGELHLKDDATIAYNGVDYPKNSLDTYFGGGSILLWKGDLYASGNASISNNFVQLNEQSDSGYSRSSVQVEQGYYIYLKDNVRIFGNRADATFFYENYTLYGGIESNVFAKSNNIRFNGPLTSQAKIGFTTPNPAVDLKIAEGDNYNLTDADINYLFYDSGDFCVKRDANAAVLSKDYTFVRVTNDPSYTLEEKMFEIILSTKIHALEKSDIRILKNRLLLTDAEYTLTLEDTLIRVSLSAIEKEDLITVEITKNGYKINGQAPIPVYEKNGTSQPSPNPKGDTNVGIIVLIVTITLCLLLFGFFVVFYVLWKKKDMKPIGFFVPVFRKINSLIFKTTLNDIERKEEKQSTSQEEK